MKYLFLLAFALSLQSLISQNQFIDTSFGAYGGYTATEFDHISLWYTNVLEHEESIYATHNDGNNDIWLVKHDLNGIVDIDFGTDGTVLFARTGRSFNALGQVNNLLGLTTDNKLIIAQGTNPHIYPNDNSLITKLNLNGSLDTTYGDNGRVFSPFNMVVDPLGAHKLADDTMYFVGFNSEVFPPNFIQDVLITRVNPDGTIDTNFGTNGMITLPYDYQTYVPTQAIYKDESIYIKFYQAEGDDYITKFDTDTLTYDTNFGVNGQLTIDNLSLDESSEAFLLDEQNNIYVAGSLPPGSGLDFEFFLCKYSGNNLDPNFGDNGIVRFNLIENTETKTLVKALNIHDDKILVLGTVYTWNGGPYEKIFFAEFQLDGSRNLQFGIDGIIINELFDSHNNAFNYLHYEDSMIACGTCPLNVPSQNPCLIKFTKSPYLNVDDYQANEINFYPNPTKDFIHFNTKEPILSVDVFDMTGRLLRSQQATQSKINMKSFNAGTYLINLYTAGAMQTLKIIKR